MKPITSYPELQSALTELHAQDQDDEHIDGNALIMAQILERMQAMITHMQEMEQRMAALHLRLSNVEQHAHQHRWVFGQDKVDSQS